MGKLRRFLILPGAERFLLLKAWGLLGAIKLGLCLLPFPMIRRILGIMSQKRIRPARPGAIASERVVWAVEVASRYVRGGENCLARALTAKILLGQFGHAADLRIGVTRSEKGEVTAHAWLESQGRVLIGRLADLSKFKPFPTIKTDEP